VSINVNFNVFFKLIKVHILVSEIYKHKGFYCHNSILSISFIKTGR